VDQTGRCFVATRDLGRDWVKNAKKNPLVSVKVRNATRSMRAVPLTAESDKDYVRRLYRKKYFMIKLLELLGRSRPSKYGAFELISA
jgi:F420H(2)-dependent quinone reductase